MDHLAEYVSIYGLAILVIAVSIIAFIGLLKLCGVFKKLNNVHVKKAIYYSLDAALSFIGALLYFKIFDKNFDQYVTYSLAQVAVTTMLYAIYENFGIRALIRKLINALQTAIKNSKDKRLIRFVQGMGIERVLQEIQKLVTDTSTQESKSDE